MPCHRTLSCTHGSKLRSIKRMSLAERANLHAKHDNGHSANSGCWYAPRCILQALGGSLWILRGRSLALELRDVAKTNIAAHRCTFVGGEGRNRTEETLPFRAWHALFQGLMQPYFPGV